jgi:hypothetical protein
MRNIQSGAVLQSEILGKNSDGLGMKSSVKRAIREGSVNWMEFATPNDGDGLDDCSEVLLNYCGRGLMNSDEDKLKSGAKTKDGPGKSKNPAQRLRNGPAKQKDNREERG